VGTPSFSRAGFGVVPTFASTICEGCDLLAFGGGIPQCEPMHDLYSLSPCVLAPTHNEKDIQPDGYAEANKTTFESLGFIFKSCSCTPRALHACFTSYTTVQVFTAVSCVVVGFFLGRNG